MKFLLCTIHNEVLQYTRPVAAGWFQSQVHKTLLLEFPQSWASPVLSYLDLVVPTLSPCPGTSVRSSLRSLSAGTLAHATLVLPVLLPDQHCYAKHTNQFILVYLAPLIPKPAGLHTCTCNQYSVTIRQYWARLKASSAPTITVRVLPNNLQ